MLISYLDESAGFILTFIILFVHDFHMVIVTSSYVRSERKPFPQELCDCLFRAEISKTKGRNNHKVWKKIYGTK